MSALIHGETDPRFAAVRDAFAANFEDELDRGAAFAVIDRGEPVVDLWGGFGDAAGARPWARDSLVNVWSTTKGVVAIAIAMLVDRGGLDYEAPVARYWPAFAAAGKGGMTVGCMMSHQGGLPGCIAPMTPAQSFEERVVVVETGEDLSDRTEHTLLVVLCGVT